VYDQGTAAATPQQSLEEVLSRFAALPGLCLEWASLTPQAALELVELVNEVERVPLKRAGTERYHNGAEVFNKVRGLLGSPRTYIYTRAHAHAADTVPVCAVWKQFRTLIEKMISTCLDPEARASLRRTILGNEGPLYETLHRVTRSSLASARSREAARSGGGRPGSTPTGYSFSLAQAKLLLLLQRGACAVTDNFLTVGGRTTGLWWLGA
jgi:hypothetical protein